MDGKFKNLYHLVKWAMFSLCVLCIGLPAVQWWEIANDILLSPIAALAAIAIGIGKLALFPLAAENQKRGQWLPAASMFAVALISFWLSVNATRDLLQNLEQQRVAAFKSQSENYQEAKRDLETVNAELNTLATLLAVDAETNYRKRAYENRPALAQLREEKRKLLETINSPGQTAHAAPGWTFGKNVHITTPYYSTTLQGSTLTAISLHLICVVLLLAVTAWWPEEKRTNEETTVKKRERSEKPKQQNTKRPVQPKTDNTPEALNDEQLNLAIKITAGIYGNDLAIRKLIKDKAMPGGYNKIKPVFDYLEAKQVLRNTGNGYELIQTTI